MPALETVGIDVIARRDTVTACRMRAPSTLLDQDGATATGALAVLADGVLGFAITYGLPQVMGMVTTHLHLELVRPLPTGTIVLEAAGRRRGTEGAFAIGEADISTADGSPVAQATIGALFLPRPPPDEPRRARPETPVAEAAAPVVRPHRLLGGAPVHTLLGTQVRRARRDGVRVMVNALPSFANSMGGVHGGVGVLMGERALDLALRAAIPDERKLRPVELRAAFLRPIAADGRAVECHAAVMHLGRRLAAVRGEVRDHEGRTAVLVDATYVARDDA
ncbi:MAG TPA: hotdog fold thioesterase [Acidimicrobiales bacterium]|nr:hotdog fold thioesterase [Acidimicrobiales bacterium]